MKINNQFDIEENSKEYAIYLHNKFGIGNKEKQNGILLFLSIKDRAIYISYGNGFSNQFNNMIIQLLIEHIKPYLREGKYGKALEAAVVEIDLIINDAEKSSIQKNAITQSRIQSTVTVAFFIIFATVGFIIYRSHQQEANLKKGEKALAQLMKDVSNESDNKFQFTSCPICLEDFHYPPKQDNMEYENPRSLESELSNPTEISSSPSLMSSSSTSSLLTNSNDPLRPMALHCGHTFCYSCLKTYLKDKKNGHKCPICRLPVDPDAPPPPIQPPSSYDPTNCHQYSSSTMESTNFRYHSPEITYRMNRMRYLYPTVMTIDTYERMNRGILNSSAQEFIQAARIRRDEVTREISNIQLRREKQYQGSRGSTRSSWGGGSSGGGGGGRW